MQYPNLQHNYQQIHMAKLHKSVHITEYTKFLNKRINAWKGAPLTWKSLLLMVAQLWLCGTQNLFFSLPN